MSDSTLFEQRLGALLRSYADAAPVEVDAGELATTISRRESRIVRVLGVTFAKPRWLTPLAVAVLLVLALAAAVLVGAQLLRTRNPVYNPLHIQAASFMSQQRGGGVAVRLLDGRVLIAGGRNGYVGGNTNYAEIFDPTTGAFEPTGSAPPLSIRGQAATLLRDGRVLITGGYDDSSQASHLALLYDPKSAAFTQLPDMLAARANHASVLMSDGTIALIGGATRAPGGSPADPAIELFDPLMNTFAPGPAVSQLDAPAAAAFGLGGSRVVVIPFGSTAQPLILDTANGDMRPVNWTGNVKAATQMGDGRIALLVDGQEIDALEANSASAQELATVSGAIAVGPATLADGRLLIGVTDPSDCTIISAEVLDPIEQFVTRIGQIGGIGNCVNPTLATVTPLTDGGALIAGGYMSYGSEASAATVIDPK